MTVLNPSLVSPLPPTILSHASAIDGRKDVAHLTQIMGVSWDWDAVDQFLVIIFFLLRPTRRLWWTEDHNEQTWLPASREIKSVVSFSRRLPSWIDRSCFKKLEAFYWSTYLFGGTLLGKTVAIWCKEVDRSSNFKLVATLFSACKKVVKIIAGDSSQEKPKH